MPIALNASTVALVGLVYIVAIIVELVGTPGSDIRREVILRRGFKVAFNVGGSSVC